MRKAIQERSRTSTSRPSEPWEVYVTTGNAVMSDMQRGEPVRRRLMTACLAALCIASDVRELEGQRVLHADGTDA